MFQIRALETITHSELKAWYSKFMDPSHRHISFQARAPAAWHFSFAVLVTVSPLSLVDFFIFKKKVFHYPVWEIEVTLPR